MVAFRYPPPDRLRYAATSPFPHAVFDNGWDQDVLTASARDIAAFTAWDGEKQFYGAREKRHSADIARLPASVRSIIFEASSPAFLRWLEALAGIDALIPDPYLQGGGVHSIGTGGFLKIHADPNWHPQLKLYRRLNLILYLNADWQADWGGQLELFRDPQGAPEVSLLPAMNRMLVFTTDAASFHGHRHPLTCPADVRRTSIALYYYTATPPAENFAEARINADYRAASGERLIKPIGLRHRLRAAGRALFS